MCINNDKCKALDYQGDKQSTTINVYTARNSVIADKPCDVFRGQLRSPNMVPFDMLHMVCYYCPVATLSDFRDLENRITGPSTSLEMSPLNRTHATSYWRFIVTTALSSVVSETCNVEKCRVLEIRVRGHSRPLKVVPFDRLPVVSY